MLAIDKQTYITWRASRHDRSAEGAAGAEIAPVPHVSIDARVKSSRILISGAGVVMPAFRFATGAQSRLLRLDVRPPERAGNVRRLSRARSRLSLCRATLLKNRPGVKRVPPGSAGVRRGPVIERLGIAGNAKRIRKESCLKMFETFAYRKSKENITFSRKVRQLIFSPGAKRVQPGG